MRRVTMPPEQREQVCRQPLHAAAGGLLTRLIVKVHIRKEKSLWVGVPQIDVRVAEMAHNDVTKTGEPRNSKGSHQKEVHPLFVGTTIRYPNHNTTTTPFK